MTRISSPPALDYKCVPSQSADTTVSGQLRCALPAQQCLGPQSLPTVQRSHCGCASLWHETFPVCISHTAWCCSEYKDRLHNCVADDGQGSLHLRFELRMSEVKGLIEAFSKKQVPHKSQAAACILLSLPISA